MDLLEKEALRLPAGERADALLASLDDEAAQKIEAAWEEVAEERLEAYERGEETAMDGATVLAKLRAKFGQGDTGSYPEPKTSSQRLLSTTNTLRPDWGSSS